MGKTRSFVVTQWNLDCDYQKLFDSGQFKFFAYGDETCPDTGRPHHQLFLYFFNPKSDSVKNLNIIGNMFGPTHCRVAAMRGSFMENNAYCSKESTLKKFGVEPKQGVRGDLEETRDSIVRGNLTPDDICLLNPEFYHKYGRTMEKIHQIALRRKFRKEMTLGVWITGPSGAGKTHMAMEGYKPETHYIKNLNEEWWDGYTGQEIVIINEFRGQITFSELLDLVDKWPKLVKWRNRESVPFLGRKVIITSIMDPKECYHNLCGSEKWSQFDRRFKIIKLEQKYSEGNIRTSDPFCLKEMRSPKASRK